LAIKQRENFAVALKDQRAATVDSADWFVFMDNLSEEVPAKHLGVADRRRNQLQPRRAVQRFHSLICRLQVSISNLRYLLTPIRIRLTCDLN
jgi:hypothetical protein